MIPALVNPERFMAFSRWAAPLLGVLAVIAAAIGLVLDFQAPPDYQQGYTVHIMFIHVPAAFMGEFVYACLGVASFLSLVFRHALAQAAARAAAPLAPNVPLVTPEKTSEIAAASISNRVTQASHSESAAARPRRPSTAARSCRSIATFSRAVVGDR